MKINQLKMGTFLSYFSMGAGYLVTLVYTPIMLRLLGQNEYGLYNLVSSVVAYLGLLNFGMGNAYIRFYIRYKVENERKKIAKLNGLFLILFTFVAVVAVICGIFLVFNARLVFGSELTPSELDTARVLLSIMVFNTAISFPNIVFNSYITANEKFIFQKLMEMIRILVNPFIVLPLLLLGFGSIGLVISTTLLTIIIEISNIIYCFKKLKIEFEFKGFENQIVREILVFSSYVFIGLIVDQINWNVDKFILGRYHGAISVAIYGLAAQINTYYTQLSTAISNVFIPRVNVIVSDSNDNNILTKLFTKIGRLQFLILALVSSGFVFFGKPFINFWAGESYQDTYLVLLFLILPVTVPLIQNTGLAIQKAKNLHRFRSLLYLGIAICNVFLTLYSANIYGAIGAAIGTAISLIIGNVFCMNWYYHKKIGLDIIFFWKNIISMMTGLVIPFIYGLVINMFVDLDNLYFFLSSGLIYVLIYLFSMWSVGMNEYEKNLIGRPLKKLISSK